MTVGEIATATPRNDGGEIATLALAMTGRILSLRGVKRRSNLKKVT